MRFVLALAFTLVFAASASCQQSTEATPPQSATPPASIDKPATSSAAPEHPITAQQVHEMMQLTGANRVAAQVIHGMLANMRQSFPPYVPKDVTDEIQSSLEKFDFEPMALESYRKHISTEDAAEIIAFYKTPAGHRLTTAMPLIAQDMQESGAQAGKQIVQEIVQRHMDEIQAAAKKYQDEHSQAPVITAPN